MGRFSRKFEDLGSELDNSQWMEEMSSMAKHEVIVEKQKPAKKSPRKK
jgi:hypothetical protein